VADADEDEAIPSGTLGVANTVQATFSATGIDAGYISSSVSASKLVNYK
jgi:hypothetical protein